jgi:hypothetical protein
MTELYFALPVYPPIDSRRSLTGALCLFFLALITFAAQSGPPCLAAKHVTSWNTCSTCGGTLRRKVLDRQRNAYEDCLIPLV